MNVKEKIIEVSKLLDELEQFETEIPTREQYYDYRLSDLYHLLENSKLNSKFCYRFCKELQLILKERRKFKNNAQVYYELRRNKDKFFIEQENRKIALSKSTKLVNKEESQLTQRRSARRFDYLSLVRRTSKRRRNS